MEDDEDDRALIAAVWARSHERLLGRVAVIEGAVVALGRGALTDEERALATGEAHKLAGSLGTFGVAEGSVVARRLEDGLAAPGADAAALGADAAHLRALVEAGPAA